MKFYYYLIYMQICYSCKDSNFVFNILQIFTIGNTNDRKKLYLPYQTVLSALKVHKINFGFWHI